MQEVRFFKEICNTEANLEANLQTQQVGITNDTLKFVYKDSNGTLQKTATEGFDVSFNDVTVIGDFVAQGSAYVGTTLDVLGASTFYGNLTINGAFISTPLITVNNIDGTSISGNNLHITADAHVGTLYAPQVSGSTNINGAVIIQNNLNVSGSSVLMNSAANNIAGRATQTVDVSTSGFAPTSFAIELTNTLASATNAVTISAGSLPVNSIVCLSNIDTNYGVTINSTAASAQQSYIDLRQSVLYIKTSVGWLPVSGTTPVGI